MDELPHLGCDAMSLFFPKDESPAQILARFYQQANDDLTLGWVDDGIIRSRIWYLANCQSNRAGVRLLMSCMLAKVHRPEVDPREPYTEIGTQTCFSGRTYDEQFITSFINENSLPCNTTTAYLTPAFRNHSAPLVVGTELTGRPREMYSHLLAILDSVATGRVQADDVLSETLRLLSIIRNDEQARRIEFLNAIQAGDGRLPLSSEAIVKLIEQHLACRNSSRLPVLVVAAAYKSAGQRLGEEVGDLHAHNAADEQTGALGDVEVFLVGENHVATAYEMKTRRVTIDDIDRGIEKIEDHQPLVDNYVFVTTEPIDPVVQDYACRVYETLGGVEMVVLDCIGFLRHFLHLFHRSRMEFLEAYQELLLNEPASAVSEALKTAFLSLRRTAESE